ncbi:MAG: ABC transporter permease subunit [Kiritimatiellae bacterium]|nr:ABC transporter permease subunit [Kiritimatiellia bacterium]
MKPGIRNWTRTLTAAAMAVSAMTVLAIVLFVFVSAAPLLREGNLAEAFGPVWRPSGEPARYGILPMVLTSLALSLGAVVLALPLAIGVCLFAHGTAPPRLARFVLGLVHFMTGIPTVVYAFAGMCVLVPFVRARFAYGSGFCLLSAMPVLALLILPTLVLLLHAYMRQAGARLTLTCASLGMSRLESVVRVLLPISRKALVAAAVLGFCRAVGDTLVALMLAGNAPQFPTGLFRSVRALTAHVALVLATDWHSPEFRSLAAAGLVLFLLTACLSLAIRRICHVHPSSELS